jgi:hypothetical protein
MRSERTYVAYGVAVALAADDLDVLTAMRRRLPPAARASTRSGALPYELRAVADGYRLTLPGQRVFETSSLAGALHVLQADVEAHVAELAPRRIFVHAAVVADGARAVLLPGRSFSGKSMLAAALVRAGATYYSDEFAVLDRRGYVHPYPRPIALRDGAAPRTTNGAAGRARPPLPVGTVAFLRFDPRAAGCRLERLSTGGALLRLLANTVAVRRSPDRALQVLSRAVGSSPTFLAGLRGDADATAATLLALVRGRDGMPEGS